MVATASFMVGTASRVYSFAGPSVVGVKYRFGSAGVGEGAPAVVFGVSSLPGEVIAVVFLRPEGKLGGDITGPIANMAGPNPPSFPEMSQQKL
jgi:hypothetical protein